MDLDAYQAARESAAVFDLSGRGKVRASGADRVGFLHSMVSNDVARLPVHAGRYNTFLTMKGKIVADFFLYKFEDCILLDLHPDLTGPLMETLDKFIVMDEVDLKDMGGEWAHFSLQGPRSGELAERLVETAPPQEHLRLAPGTFQGEEAWVVAKADLAPRGCEILLPASGREAFARAAESEGAGAETGDEEVREVLRVEAGIPLYPSELNDTRYPMEARLDEALDFDKGCYIGQEVVAKPTYIGSVARLLARLKVEGRETPERGAKLLNEKGRSAGLVTSAVYSPRLERPIALGFVKKAFAEPGQSLDVALGGERSAKAEVVADFS